MRILEVIQSLGSGGAERLVVDLCNEFAKTQDVYLLILKDAEHFYMPQVANNVKIIEAKMPIGGSIKQLISCCKYIKKINPDIIHFHSRARYTILLANILYGRKYKFYMTIHNDVFKSYKSGLSGLQVKMSALLGHTKFITISPTNYEQFKQVYPKYKQTMIRNGRALPKDSIENANVEYEVNSYKNNCNTLVFLHVARCQEVKNQHLLIKSINNVIKKGENITLLIIGTGFDSKLGEDLKSISCSNIHFLGTRENVYDYMKYSDAFLLSSWQEGMPMTIIEAILSGIPIISTPVCGAIDAIIDNTNGLICTDFTEKSYTETLLKGIKEINKLKSNAKINADRSPWSIKSCAESHLKWFVM